jgi:hypothetical protein
MPHDGINFKRKALHECDTLKLFIQYLFCTFWHKSGNLGLHYIAFVSYTSHLLQPDVNHNTQSEREHANKEICYVFVFLVFQIIQ